MKFHLGRSARLLVFFLLIGSGLSLIPLEAQDSGIILTIGLEQWQADIFDFSTFEAAHSGVKVIPVVLNDAAGRFGIPSNVEAVGGFIDSLNTYTRQADL